MIGNLDNAKKIYHADREGKIPPGWSKVGSGGYRRVYRGPDGYVYKVASEYYKNRARPNSNDEELLKSKKIVLQEKTYPGWRVAPVDSHCFDSDDVAVTVNAMEYVKGRHEFNHLSIEQACADHKEYFEILDSVFFHFGLGDAHSGNYLLTPWGERVIVDCAS